MATRFQVLSVFLTVSLFHMASVSCSDPDPLLDNPANVTEFVLRSSFVNGDVTVAPGGVRVGLNINLFPALTNQGVTNVQFQLVPCGVNPPHTHPRATELLTLISGGPLQAGLVNTEGEAFIYILYPGDIIVFPRGLLHFELNVGNETAYFISALNSQNPGTLTAGGALLKLPTRALASALNQDMGIAERLASQIYPYGPQLEFDPNSGCFPGQDVISVDV